MNRIFTTVAFMVAVASPWASAMDTTDIRTAAQLDTEPKYMRQLNGGLAGIGGLCIDLNRAIERVDPSIRFTGDQNWLPAIRLEAELAFGHIDNACGFSRTPERAAKFIYVEPALFSVTYHLAARMEDDATINGWDDVRRLGGKGTVLTVHGFGPVSRLREMGGIRVDAGSADVRSNLFKLVNGRGRFFYHRMPGLEIEIRKAGLDDAVKILPASMDRQDLYFVFGKSTAGATVEKVRQALAVLEKSGELKRIVSYWLNARSDAAGMAPPTNR
jgi:glutamate/aspartate transport system substrate-binding protein